ncbi:LysR family transcriptional regulator [Anaerotignum faecicola]|nr:LysR family transcriptional regulator [Anaerotignum faecicola]
MTFLQLKYISEIYNCGSINKAAQNLFVSQSSLSSSIRELEQELGIKIFIRSNRGIVLTEDGQEFLVQVRPIIEQQKKVERFYNDRYGHETAKLNISAQRYPICTKAFVELMNMEECGKFEFSFKETDMDKVIENVKDRKSHIGIIFLSDMTEKFMNRVLNASEIEFNEIKRIKPHVFLNINHPLAEEEEISLSDLAKYPYLVFSKKDNTSSNFSEEAVFSGSYCFDKIIYINDRATAYNILSHSKAFTTGSGVLPKGYVPPDIKAVPVKDKIDYMRIGWIKLKEFTLNDRAEKFIKCLKEMLDGKAVV